MKSCKKKSMVVLVDKKTIKMEVRDARYVTQIHTWHTEQGNGNVHLYWWITKITEEYKESL